MLSLTKGNCYIDPVIQNIIGINTIKGLLNSLLLNMGILIGLPGLIITQTGKESLIPVQVSAVCMALILIVVFSYLTWYFLDRKLNLE